MRNSSALQLAAENGHVETVCLLLNYGAQITPHLMHMFPGSIVDGEDIDEFGFRSLALAAAGGHGEVVRWLLIYGADVHWGEDEALRLAARNGHLEMIIAGERGQCAGKE
jgi:ankyrin repeat protein